MIREQFVMRALQIGERIDVKGLEREDAFSATPLGFRTPGGGAAILFKSGAAVFARLSPVEEEEFLRALMARVGGVLTERETETAHVAIVPNEDDTITATGLIQIKSLDPTRLLLVAQALATSVSFSLDERRIARAFERIETLASTLARRRLPPGSPARLLEQIGEALLLQHRLASRVDLDDKPDVLWDHPEFERFWTRLVEEYDLPQRARAIERKLTVIRETVDTISDLVATRTSHRLEWYIIALIMIEIALGLYERLR